MEIWDERRRRKRMVVVVGAGGGGDLSSHQDWSKIMIWASPLWTWLPW